MQVPITGGPQGGEPAMIFAPEPQAGSFTSNGEQAQAATGPAAFSFADQAKSKLTGALDGQKGAATDMIEQLAGNVQRYGEQFQGKQDWIASAIGRGATELNTLAASLRNKDIGDLGRDVQAFAKARPALFMGAALVAGFAVARLGKLVAGDLSRDDLPTMPEVTHGRH